MTGEQRALSIRIDEAPPGGWDELIMSGEARPVHLYHSTSWALRMHDLFRLQPYYVSVLSSGVPLLCLLGLAGYYRPVGHGARALVRRFLDSVPFRPLDFRWYGEPIHLAGASADAYSFLASYLESFLKTKRFKLHSGEWPIDQAGSLPSAWNVRTWATLKIDLSKPLDSVFATFRSSARKELRKARDAGVSVRRVESIDELREYYDCASRWSRRYGKMLYGFEDFASLWRRLRGWGVYESFVAYHAGAPIAGLSICGDRRAVVETGSFQSEESYLMKLGGPDMLKWEAIQWTHSQGIPVFDLAGVSPRPIAAKEIGIRRFKEKWSSAEHLYCIVSR